MQVILYVLMLYLRESAMAGSVEVGDHYDEDEDTAARRGALVGREGLLLHLSEGETRFEVITPQWDEIRSLILSRNELAHYLRTSSAPSALESGPPSQIPCNPLAQFEPRSPLAPMLNKPHECGYCYQAAECMVHHAVMEGGSASTSGAPAVFAHSMRGLTEAHARYLRDWEELLTMEEMAATARKANHNRNGDGRSGGVGGTTAAMGREGGGGGRSTGAGQGICIDDLVVATCEVQVPTASKSESKPVEGGADAATRTPTSSAPVISHTSAKAAASGRPHPHPHGGQQPSGPSLSVDNYIVVLRRCRQGTVATTRKRRRSAADAVEEEQQRSSTIAPFDRMRAKDDTSEVPMRGKDFGAICAVIDNVEDDDDDGVVDGSGDDVCSPFRRLVVGDRVIVSATRTMQRIGTRMSNAPPDAGVSIGKAISQSQDPPQGQVSALLPAPAPPRGCGGSAIADIEDTCAPTGRGGARRAMHRARVTPAVVMEPNVVSGYVVAIDDDSVSVSVTGRPRRLMK